MMSSLITRLPYLQVKQLSVGLFALEIVAMFELFLGLSVTTGFNVILKLKQC